MDGGEYLYYSSRERLVAITTARFGLMWCLHGSSSLATAHFHNQSSITCARYAFILPFRSESMQYYRCGQPQRCPTDHSHCMRAQSLAHADGYSPESASTFHTIPTREFDSCSKGALLAAQDRICPFRASWRLAKAVPSAWFAKNEQDAGAGEACCRTIIESQRNIFNSPSKVLRHGAFFTLDLALVPPSVFSAAAVSAHPASFHFSPAGL